MFDITACLQHLNKTIKERVSVLCS